ncbi:MAG TPA: ribosomal protein S18-alanine N-acetyltransferase [Gemmatimonadales bacterium]
MSPDTGPVAGVVVRRARRDDLAGIVDIERRSFSDPWTLHAFGAALARDDVHFAVAECPGASLVSPAGYLVAWFMGDEGEIGNVAVDDRCRGQGIGAALLDDALAAAERAGVRDMYLEVRESNAAARSLYASRSFAQVGRRRRYYRAPVEDALVLHRALDGAGPPDPGAGAGAAGKE